MACSGEQSLLFFNRRGYAPLNICQACAIASSVRNCSSWLVEHRYRDEARPATIVAGQSGRSRIACLQCGAGERDRLVGAGGGCARRGSVCISGPRRGTAIGLIRRGAATACARTQ